MQTTTETAGARARRTAAVTTRRINAIKRVKLIATLVAVVYTNVRRCGERIIRDACINNHALRDLYENLGPDQVIGIWSQTKRHFVLIAGHVQGGDVLPIYRLDLNRRDMIFTPQYLEKAMEEAGWQIDGMDLFWEKFMEVTEAHNGCPVYGGG
jgi:hypothetical protein